MYSYLLTAGIALLSTVSARAVNVSPRTTPALPLAVTELVSFGEYTWAENLAIRANGEILVTRIDLPGVVQVSPTNAYEPVIVYNFSTTDYYGVLGITETTPDTFYFAAAAFVDDDFVKTSGTNAIYKLNMATFKITNGVVTSKALVTKVVDIPGADFLNGLTTLDDTHVYAADAYNGWVYLIDVAAGTYKIAINDAKMKYPATSTTNLGVNGIKISGNYLYWTNTGAGTLNRVAINKTTGAASGTSTVVTANVPKADDFVIKSDGTIFIAQNQQDELSVLTVGSSVAKVAAGSDISTILAGVTAGHFGRLASDANRLYLTTSGALGLPINGTVTVPGTVSYVDTTGF